MPRLLKVPTRIAAISLVLPLLAASAIWPENLGNLHRTSAHPVAPTADQAIWDEHGLQEAETAQYETSGEKFTATAYRFQDPTGAMAGFEWLRPADSTP